MKIIQIIGIILGITVIVWVLRGFGLLGFIPGGILWLLIGGAIAIGIFGIVQDKLRRL